MCIPADCVAGKSSRLVVVFGLTGSISVWFELRRAQQTDGAAKADNFGLQRRARNPAWCCLRVKHSLCVSFNNHIMHFQSNGCVSCKSLGSDFNCKISLICLADPLTDSVLSITPLVRLLCRHKVTFNSPIKVLAVLHLTGSLRKWGMIECVMSRWLERAWIRLAAMPAAVMCRNLGLGDRLQAGTSLSSKPVRQEGQKFPEAS